MVAIVKTKEGNRDTIDSNDLSEKNKRTPRNVPK